MTFLWRILSRQCPDCVDGRFPAVIGTIGTSEVIEICTECNGRRRIFRFRKTALEKEGLV